MSHTLSRREFLAALAAASAAPALATATLETASAPPISSIFQVGVFTDEISRDFELACKVAREFGLSFVELRAMWGKNIIDQDEKQLARARDILKEYQLAVTCISGPLYKVDFPGAPKSKHSPDKATVIAAGDWSKQDAVLDKEIDLAKFFGTKHIRCFDFWRLEDPAPFRAAMDERLTLTAEKAAKHGLTVVMENEHACNTRTAAEAVRTLEAVKHPNFKLIWDPGNSAYAGEVAFPDGYNLLPKDRIGHVHCKNVMKKDNGKARFLSMAEGSIDYAAQFAALKKDGFTGPVVLETHWKLDGSAENASRQSLKEMLDQLRKAGAWT